MSTGTSDSISIYIGKTVGIIEFIPIPGASWNVDWPGPLEVIWVIVLLSLVLLMFLFPFWYVYTLKGSTTRIEDTLSEIGNRMDSPKDMGDGEDRS